MLYIRSPNSLFLFKILRASLKDIDELDGILLSGNNAYPPMHVTRASMQLRL